VPAWDNILKSLESKELILPILENQMRADRWPKSYQITIDSGEYYGKGDGYFHPSTHPLMTARQLYYLFNPKTRHLVEEEPFSIQREMTLSVGTAVHGVVQTQMEMAELLTKDDTEVEYINVEHHVRGRADAVAHHPTEGPVLLELKTRTSRKFDETTLADMPSWEAQVSLACDNLGERYDTDFTYGIVIMMESGWPYRLREIRVPRNDELLREIYAKFDQVREAVATETPPPLCCAYNSKEMRSCRMRYACWLKDKT